jgi:hypothetical protein
MKIREIELAALSIVKHLLAADGYDVSAGARGYDLKATKGDEELHIEVKGAGARIATSGGHRYLTDGEFNAARKDPKWELWVLENVGEASGAMVTRLPRREVLAELDIEVRWRLRWDRDVQALAQPLSAETVAEAMGATGEKAP